MLQFIDSVDERHLWYFVGLITADGCLYKDGRHVEITSKEYVFLNKIKNALSLKNKIGIKYNSFKQRSYRMQIANKHFYDFLLSIGLMPNKSSILKSIKIPQAYFRDFLRGVIDGDGSIKYWTHPGNRKEQISLCITSASEGFIAWLRERILCFYKAKGRIHKECTGNWLLKYGKMSARKILKECYYVHCLGLDRKITKAQRVIHSYQGWRKSKLIA
jgi:hypothetical protein